MTERESKYEHFASSTSARGGLGDWFCKNDCPTKVVIFVGKWLFPKMTQKCMGVLGGHPRLIRTYFWRLLIGFDRTSPKNNYYKTPIKIPIHFYFDFCLRYLGILPLPRHCVWKLLQWSRPGSLAMEVGTGHRSPSWWSSSRRCNTQVQPISMEA